MSKIFMPHELKTIEVDTEKKIFRISGDRYQKPHTLHKQSRVCESCGNDTVE